MELELWVIALLCVVFFFAGFLDGVAGGGGLLSLPALLLTGMPPAMALGTNKAVAYCGLLASLGSYARSGLVFWKTALTGIPASLVGVLIGTNFLLSMDNAVIGKIVVFMLPVGMLAIFMPKKDKGAREMQPLDFYCKLPLLCFVMGLYDGFFGPGTGSFMVMGLHLFLGLGLLPAVAISKMILVTGGVAGLAVFVIKGYVNAFLVLPFGASCVIGNIVGSKVAMRVGPGLVRRFLAFSLVLLFGSLIWKFWLPA